MIFFTADSHLGHGNIIKHCNRPFSSVEEMDEHLITVWNSHVYSNDSVYILGDFIFRNTISPNNYLSRLNGKKHLLLGNHDTKWIKKVDLTKHFATVDRFLEISHCQRRITLCHYPLMSWSGMAKGSYMIHGHIHNNREAFYFPTLQKMPNLLNAGVDINEFRPVELDELVKNNETFKSERIEKEFGDTFIKNIVAQMQGMTERAIYQFTPAAEDIIAGRITGENDIGYQLDFMLDFCDNDKVLDLYKRVLRSLQNKYPKLIANYIQAYKDMWDSEETDLIIEE